MGRHKTISDEDVLAAARGVFQEKGHAASTREIAAAAGVSEAVLYQRFKSKNALFFSAMLPCGPDLAAVLGPAEPASDAHAYVRGAVERMAVYFAECLPAAMQVMMHPAFDAAAFAKSGPMTGTERLATELAARLRRLHRRRQIAATSFVAAARSLTALAHDWALHAVLSGRIAKADRHHLLAMADVVWHGLAPASSDNLTRAPRPAATADGGRRRRRPGGSRRRPLDT